MAVKQSSALSILQEAATQALLEDKEEGLGGLLIAADQIANERGLISPLRRRSPLDRSFELSQSLDRHSLTERGVLNMNGLEGSVRSNRSGSLTAAHATSVHGKENDDDANALLNQMNIQPTLKPSDDVAAFEADVDALMEMGGQGGGGGEGGADGKKTKGKSGKIRPNTSSPQRWKSGSGLGRQRYKDRIKQYGRRSEDGGFGRSYYSSGGSGAVTSEPSRTSVMLMMADEKSYGDRVRASFKSEMQEMLFRSMHLVRATSASSSASYSSSGASRREKEKQRMMSERLSRPAQHAPSKLDVKLDPTLKHSTYDDAKETTFRPTIHGRSKRAEAKQRADVDDDDGPVRKEDPKYSFISRQEAEERNRREELAYKIGKQDYDALLNKRVCPKCGAKQSYDEVKEKRKLCPNCRVEYIIPLTWAQVSKGFFQKCLDYSQRVQQHKEAVRKEVEDEYRYVTRREIDPTTGKHYLVREQRSHRLTKEQEEDFLQRVQEHVDRHKGVLRQLETQIVAEYFPFKPQIAKYLKPRRRSGDEDLDEEDLEMFDDEDEEEDGANPIQAFLRRYERDMEARREKMPERYLATRKYRSKKKGEGGDDSSGDDDEQDDRRDNSHKRERSFRF